MVYKKYGLPQLNLQILRYGIFMFTVSDATSGAYTRAAILII